MSIKKAAHIVINSVADVHRQLSLAPPVHPLISVIREAEVKGLKLPGAVKMVSHLYVICLEADFKGKVRYGQGYYDFSEGVMFFTGPGQVTEMDEDDEVSGQWLIIHPHFFHGYPLEHTIGKFGYFSYAVNETLFLTENEKKVIEGLMAGIAAEYNSNTDRASHDIMIAQLELLLSYCNRFYDRQFVTPKKNEDDLLIKMERILTEYFNKGKAGETGIPSVQYLAGRLNYSPTYLSDMLRAITGQTTQQHIHNKLIEKAKELLLTTKMSASEIAYELGFEHPQSFSKLFRSKMNVSPIEFRKGQ